MYKYILYCDGSETPCIILLRIALLLYMISTVVLMCTIVVYKLAFHLINLKKFSSCFNTSVPPLQYTYLMNEGIISCKEGIKLNYNL